MELPVLDARAQGRARAGRGLHHRRQTRDRHALFRPRMGRAGRGGGIPRGRGERGHGIGPGDRGRDDGARRGAQDHLHRLHRGRQGADPAIGRHGEEGVDGTGRQRALHRFRRRRSGCRRRGGHRLEIPQLGPDLRLRQPHLRAGRGLRRLRREARGENAGAEGRRRPRGRRGAGPADRQGRRRQGRGASGRRQGQGRDGRAGRVAPPAGRHLLPADRPDRGHAGHGLRHRGDFRPARPRLPLRDGGAEAVEMANATVFGLASYVYTRDLGRAFR
jgi:hypothetical protein